jgi:hypothetical protein
MSIHGPLSFSVLSLAEVERDVVIPDHVLDLEPAQEECHEDEVEEQKRPVYFQIRRVETRKKCCDARPRHQLLPQLHLLQLSLEAFVLIVLARRQNEFTATVGSRLELHILWVFRWCQIKHEVVQVEQSEQIGNHCVALLLVHSKNEECKDDGQGSPSTPWVNGDSVLDDLHLALDDELEVLNIDDF